MRAQKAHSAQRDDGEEEHVEDGDYDEEEQEEAPHTSVPAPQSVPPSAFNADAPVFAARQYPSLRPPGYKATMTVEDEVGKVFEISKTQACAIISGHPRCSKDRLVRVRAQK